MHFFSTWARIQFRADQICVLWSCEVAFYLLNRSLGEGKLFGCSHFFQLEFWSFSIFCCLDVIFQRATVRRIGSFTLFLRWILSLFETLMWCQHDTSVNLELIFLNSPELGPVDSDSAGCVNPTGPPNPIQGPSHSTGWLFESSFRVFFNTE